MVLVKYTIRDSNGRFILHVWVKLANAVKLPNPQVGVVMFEAERVGLNMLEGMSISEEASDIYD